MDYNYLLSHHLIFNSSQPHLNFSCLCRFPLDECYAPTEHEDREPLQPAERAVQHEDCAQGRARDLELIRHLHKETHIYWFIHKGKELGHCVQHTICTTMCPTGKQTQITQFIPGKRLRRGYSRQERPCYSELRTPLRARSASAALSGCRKHVPLWSFSVWWDFLFPWRRRCKNRPIKENSTYFRWVI